MTCPAVWIPSQLLDARMWHPLEAGLAVQGGFHADIASDDTIAGMAARLLANAPPAFCLVAQGMGGFIAFEVMRQQPARVKGMALIGTLASPDGPAQTARRCSYARLVEDGNFAQVIEERLPLLLHPDNSADPALLATLRDMAQTTGAQGFLRQQSAIIGRQDSRATLRDVACPVMLVRGSQDGITSAAHFAEMCDALPTATAVTIPDCGHVPSLERPELVGALLSGWFAAL